MASFLSTINNRELAFGIWFFFGTIALVYKAKAWGSLKSLLITFFAPPIQTYFFVLVLYVVASVVLLEKCDLWEISNLKTTIYWLVGFAFLAPFNSEKIEEEGERSFFKHAIKKAIGVNAVIAFFSSLHTFNLPVEILFTGAAIFLSLISAVAGLKEETKVVANIAKSLLLFIGLIFLSASIYSTVKNVSGITTWQNFRELVIPAFLTLLFIPFLYGSHLFIVYERSLKRIDSIIKNPVARNYARHQVIAEFLFDLDGVKKWLRHIAIFRPANEAEVAASVAEIKAVRRREKAPYKVPPAIGWEPHIARGLLEEVGLKVRDYHRSYDCWRASSNYIECSKGLHSSNIAYFLEGDEFAVLKLILILNVNGEEDAAKSREMFKDLASILVSKALKRYGMKDGELSLESGKDPVVIDGKEISLIKKDFTGGKWYELELVIEANDVIQAS